MLEETEAEEATVSFVTFLSLVAFQLRGEGGLSSLTEASKKKKKKSSKLILPVNFYYLLTKSDVKVKINIVLERERCVMTLETSAS